jgi:hypothetical protein
MGSATKQWECNQQWEEMSLESTNSWGINLQIAVAGGITNKSCLDWTHLVPVTGFIWANDGPMMVVTCKDGTSDIKIPDLLSNILVG